MGIAVARPSARRIAWTAPLRPAVALVGLALLAAVSRISSLDVPLDRDTGVYLYGGQTILHGGVPYLDAADNKGPLTALLFAPISLLAGTSAEAVRFSLVAFMAVAALAVAGYVARFAGAATGAVAGVTLAMIGSTHRLEGDDANTEQYGIAPMAVAWYLASRGTRRSAVGAGAATAAAVCMNVGFAPVGPFIAFELWRSGPGRERGGRFAAAAAGFAAVTVPILVWLGLAGALGDMRAQMLGQATEAVSGQLTGGQRLGLLQMPPPYVALALTALGGCAAAALTERRLRAVAAPVALWIVAMTARVKLSSYADGQAYFPAMPGIAAGLALGVAAVWAWLGDRWADTVARRLAIAAVLLTVIAVPYVVVPQWQQLQRAPSARLASDDLSLSLAYPVAGFIRATTPRDARIFVAGSDAEVYWLAGRRAPTRFFHAYPLRWDPRYRVERARALAAHPPAAVVVLPGARQRERAFFADVQGLLRRDRYVLRFTRDGGRVWLLDRSAPAR
ncbi:MAG: hypothetical protein QOC78_132 [Solirubrobacteraceae bacterium]|jgi:hypothetical protein|nr:hypothetical protein [Solirubrobacteraceae bacterium]